MLLVDGASDGEEGVDLEGAFGRLVLRAVGAGLSVGWLDLACALAGAGPVADVLDVGAAGAAFTAVTGDWVGGTRGRCTSAWRRDPLSRLMMLAHAAVRCPES